ncbi:hypothetical protein [Methylocella silvestris]|uniref:Uncharacterized protein n=1 Tax=Methylocella silvestris TaxID=199596 RepID=A0A2J7TJU6_METSI|nr:hypothetical protein [Methylocella silvestris]PNG27033.1 hypothetical protein CR492_04835 [Methylocella silvestris]
MSDNLQSLRKRLAQVKWRLGQYDQMIRDAHLWGDYVEIAHTERAPLIIERDQLAAQIEQIEAFEFARRPRVLC